MGLLLKLENGDTALKSLKFGKDRLGGGDSGQPYIKNPILDEPGQLSQGDNDFLLRGGLRAPINAAEDVARLTKYMVDLKSPSGLLFIAKQNLLSRVAPKTESSKGIGYAGGALNEGVYTPLSTLAQAGVGFAGIHLNKQGLDPTGLIPGLSINKYENILKDQTTDENRLVNILLYSTKNLNGVKGYDINQGQDVITYDGGPRSILGVGKTHIRYADQRTGRNNSKIPNDFFTLYGYDNYSVFKNPNQFLWQGTKIFHTSVSKKYQELTGVDPFKEGYYTIDNDSPTLQIFSNSIYKSGSLDPINGITEYQTNRLNALQNHYPTPESYPTYVSPINKKLFNTGVASRQLVKNPVYRFEKGTFIPQNVDDTDLKGASYSSENTLKRDYSNAAISGSKGYLWKDFNNGSLTHKEGYLADLDKNAGSYLENGKLVYFNNGYYGGIAPDFRLTPRDKRGFSSFNIHNQNPDQNNKIGNYNSGVGETYSRWITDGGDLNTTNDITQFRYKALDTIYYDSNSVNKSSFRKSNNLKDIDSDLINFSISIINPTNPEATGSLGSNTLRFRAYIDNFSDSYTAEWKSQTYMGRAEKFYKYDAFGRSISLGFTIVADNRDNLDTMYDQLNTLAASLAPTYTGQGYMAGNLHRVTVGNYISNQVGIMDGLTYEIIDDSSWDIDTGRQLPMYIKVTGIKFTPIHGFRPEMLWEGSQHKFVRQSPTSNSSPTPQPVLGTENNPTNLQEITLTTRRNV